MKVCPNCGAPMTGQKCEYCETEYAGKTLKNSFDKRELQTLEAKMAVILHEMNQRERKLRRGILIFVALLIAVIVVWFAFESRFDDGIPIQQEVIYEQP